MKKLKASLEFKIGKHNIGWVSSDFIKRFETVEFNINEKPPFQKLPRTMNDAEIELELKPGLCDLGDILAFMDNAPEECKDGNFNLFYTPSCVVSVFWDEFDGDWDVYAWRRDGFGWRAGKRVFSPAIKPSISESSGRLDTLTLELPDEIILQGVKYRKV